MAVSKLQRDEMRTVFFLAVLTAGILVQGERGAGQSVIGGVLWAPNIARRVTISQHGITVATLTLPTGTFLDITVRRYVEPTTNVGAWTFAGDFTLRAQPAPKPPGQEPGTAAQIMSDAPFVLTMKDGEVLVENVRP